tara:strand:- start:47519 stop:48472 length:954 start_codon:yes stop_codon:yes gene_type:complete
MSVDRLKSKQDMHISNITDNKKSSPLQNKPVAMSINPVSSNNASFDLIMSQLDIANQRAFNEYQTLQWKEASIEKKQLALLMCEVDFYEEYLSHYGEQGAAFMMLSVALALKNICALYGCFLAHHGQHRLVVLIKGGNQESVQAIANHLCDAVKNTRTEHNYSKKDHFITLSVGFSVTHPGSMAILKNQANSALTDAKLLGGNKIVHSHNKDHQAEIQARIKIRHARLKEKQQQLAPKTNNAAPTKANKDLFPELEGINPAKSKSRSKMYRGQPILEANPMDVDKNDSNHLQSSQTNKGLKKKPSSVRMYRGQIVDS